MSELRTYQKNFLRRFRSHDSFGMFWDMRLGKTKTMISFIDIHQYWPCLIVCPYGAMTSWEEEIPAENLVKIIGEKDERLSMLPEIAVNDPKYCLINKEGFLSVPQAFLQGWNSLILDESSFIKNPKAKVTKFFIKYRFCFNHKFLLTGTPAPESDMDFITQLYIMGCLHYHYYQFRFRYCYPINHRWHIKYKGKELLSEILSKNCQFLTSKQVGLDNDKTFIKRKIKMSLRCRQIYQKLEKKFVLEYKNYLKEINLNIQQFILMRYLTSGIIDNKLVFKDKLNELLYLLQTELRDQKVIIYCAYLLEIDFIKKALPKVKEISGRLTPIQREGIIKQFTTEHVNLLLIQPETTKFGVNLSCCNNIIYFSSPLGWETRQQSQSRIDMPYKKEKNLIIDLVMENSVDEDIIQLLKIKQSRQAFTRKLMEKMYEHNKNLS